MKIEVSDLKHIKGIGQKTINRVKDYLRPSIQETNKYEINPSTIYCGNTEDVLASFPENYVDLTITSPPYDNLRLYDGFTFPFEDIALQLYRVTKDGGVVVWVVGDEVVSGSETGTSFQQALTFMDIGFNLHDTMIYEKSNFSFPASTRYHQIFEYMFVLSKGKPSTFNPILDKKVKYGLPWGRNTHRQKDGSIIEVEKAEDYREYGMRTNIWKFTCGKGFTSKDEFAHEHPAIFPEELAKDHILSWSEEGHLVLDPMCGSGTTLKIAKELNRDWIGIDCSENYCDLSRRRVS